MISSASTTFAVFEAYWEIPSSEPTAVHGRWVEGPGQPFFDAVKEALGDLPIIAEDLGVITPEVEALRDDNNLPGMKVLQFAFADGAADPYLPHNYPRGCVVYTGTHDNDTTRGWYETAPEKRAGYGAPLPCSRRLQRRLVPRPPRFLVRRRLRHRAPSRLARPGFGRAHEHSGRGGGQLGLALHARNNSLPGWAPSLLEMTQLYGRSGEEEAADTPYRQTVTHDDVVAE